MNDRNHVPFMSRREMVLCIALACLNIVLCGIFAYATDIHYVILIPAVIALFLLEVSMVSAARARRQEHVPELGIYALLEENGSILFKNTEQPIAAFGDDGVMLWCNDAMLSALRHSENPVGKRFSDIFGDAVSIESFGDDYVYLGDRTYSAESFVVNSVEQKALYMLKLTDVTELCEAEKRYNDDKVCVAYIAIDNIEDVLQYVHEKFREAVAKVDEKLRAWADSMNASIKSYDNDKYIMFFDSVSLEACLDNRFAILDEIRDTRVGDGVSVQN